MEKCYTVSSKWLLKKTNIKTKQMPILIVHEYYKQQTVLGRTQIAFSQFKAFYAILKQDIGIIDRIEQIRALKQALAS